MADHRERHAGTRGSTAADDPLLGCLLLLNRARQQAIPPAVLLKGLPLEGQPLTLPLLSDAVERAGWSARLVELDLDDIPDSVLPAILLLDRRRPCVLLECREYGSFLVALPGWGGGIQEVSREELLAAYSRYAIVVQPAPQAEIQADMGRVQPGRSADARNAFAPILESLPRPAW
ncbi:cysteine peptidase family C39 domain-containing protein [Cupriavidus sp. AcVe19-1a]|uniref:cysteine peptidase family C39 domain-containing protein n=1 Tax=Cupriavidus sp. AcVe19-1a TaxID=2821359 RepID=UPI001AE18E73|nr:cysteine peptidase family C39 domain-containing protein [Cupriavidus sp. AcVe19-1a]MBP0632830.1 peptidase [Cupriavidus sp. AcVe19-1a]